MPELPEVETVRRSLAIGTKGATIVSAALLRPGLRFAFPPDLADRLTGQTIIDVHRRAKYLLVELSSGTRWLTHLGMTGTFDLLPRIDPPAPDLPAPDLPGPAPRPHTHVKLHLVHPRNGPFWLNYRDPRRFGFMDLVPADGTSPHLDHLGAEPLGNRFSAPHLARRLKNRRAPIKTTLLDQRIVAGLGNIYVCEALFEAGISPLAPSGTLSEPALERLVAAIRLTLQKAIAAGGSSLSDFFDPQGRSGYFQHQFSVYGRNGDPCGKPQCGGRVQRIVQSGRATFWCPTCQGGPQGHRPGACRTDNSG